MTEDLISPREIHHFSQEDFEHTTTGPAAGTDRSFFEYQHLLPQVEGRTFDYWIERKIEERQAEAEVTGIYRPVCILDVGYGGGKNLVELKKRWGDKVKVIGYGDSRYAKSKINPDGRTKHQTLLDVGVQLVEGSMMDLRKKVPNESVDFVLSNYVLMWANYPAWESIKKMYKILAIGGMAFIMTGDPVLWEEHSYESEDLGAKLIEEYIKAHSDIPINLNGSHITFQRTSTDIGKLKIRSLRVPRKGNRAYVGSPPIRIG